VFDIAWEVDDAVFVGEAKSLAGKNEERQLCLGLGQVLRYAFIGIRTYGDSRFGGREKTKGRSLGVALREAGRRAHLAIAVCGTSPHRLAGLFRVEPTVEIIDTVRSIIYVRPARGERSAFSPFVRMQINSSREPHVMPAAILALFTFVLYDLNSLLQA
jgi:hypothetical protein